MTNLTEAWIVEGVMPERALNRLQKAGIAVFQAKKIKKMQILFHISKKDIEKAFAIYPNMCYNNIRGSVYTFTRVGALSTRERVIRAHKAVGVLLGALVFVIAVLAASVLVLRIEVVGSSVYEREARALLRENGIALFSVYPEGKEEQLAAEILAFDGVEFCSVQKRGNTVRVEIRQNALPSVLNEDGDLVAPRSGIIESAVALGGTLLKKAGEETQAGESLVGSYLLTADGASAPARVVAKAKLICLEQVTADSEEQAFAEAMLLVESCGGRLKSISYAQGESCVTASVEFTLVIKKNM